MREIRVTCKGKTVTVETTGFGGESCRQATRELERRLGKVTSDDNTEDIYTQEQNNDVRSKA